MNNIINLTSPFLTFMSGSNLILNGIPAIESALRVIFRLGGFFINRGQYIYTDLTFKPLHHFTNALNYQFFKPKALIKFFNKIKFDQLPSFNPIEGQPTLILQLGNSGRRITVDRETFKKYSLTYQNAPLNFEKDEEMDLLNDQGEPVLNKDGQTLKSFMIPEISENYNPNGFNLLNFYLCDRTNFYRAFGENFEGLSQKSFEDLYSLIAYLDMPELEPFFMRRIVKDFIDSGSKDPGQYKGLLPLGQYAEQFNELFNGIKKFEINHIKLEKFFNLSLLNNDGHFIRENMIKNVKYCASFLTAGLVSYALLPSFVPRALWVPFPSIKQSRIVNTFMDRIFFSTCSIFLPPAFFTAFFIDKSQEIPLLSLRIMKNLVSITHKALKLIIEAVYTVALKAINIVSSALKTIIKEPRIIAPLLVVTFVASFVNLNFKII